MYVDESGGTDEVVTSEEMTVTVDGQEYTTEMNLDMSGDGEYDTVFVPEEDGGGRAFIDTNGTGEADEYVELNQQGQPVAMATYDETTGEWVAADPGQQGSPDERTQAGTDGPMTAELPDGEVQVGPPTVDTNHDGSADTAVVEEPDGTSYYFTDKTGDGEADVAVVIAPDGSATQLEHTGDGQWVETGTAGPGEAPAQGGAAPATGEESNRQAAGGEEPAGSPLGASAGAAAIDPATGEWVTR